MLGLGVRRRLQTATSNASSSLRLEGRRRPADYHGGNVKTLAEACSPRPSVFEEVGRDTVYDLADLDRIDPAVFFAENYVTEGMRLLLEEALKRLEGKPSSSGTFLLSQSMGGGKTHSLIALGLAAKYPEWRRRATEGFYEPGPLGSVRVLRVMQRGAGQRLPTGDSAQRLVTLTPHQ